MAIVAALLTAISPARDLSIGVLVARRTRALVAELLVEAVELSLALAVPAPRFRAGLLHPQFSPEILWVA